MTDAGVRTHRARNANGGPSLNGTIICALADLDGADAAVHAARRLADRFGSRIVLVSVASGAERDEGVANAETRARARRRLERLVAEHDLAARAEQRVELGSPVEILAAIAAEEAAGLIVLGSRPGLRRHTLKCALARELAAYALCPVLVAPPEAAPVA